VPDARTDLEQRLRGLLAGAPPEYVAVYLFGSHARGTARDDSDVDLAFWRRHPSAPTLDEQPYLYADELSQGLGRPVDLVELNHAPSDLVHEVLRDGRVVLDRDRDLRIQLEVRARQHYLDMRPWLLRYRGLRPDS
jgi:predicted nucleotidyltransferase